MKNLKTELELEQILHQEFNLAQVIRLWLSEAIRNQEGLKEENDTFPFPEWNKGYLTCLEDLKEIIEGNA